MARIATKSIFFTLDSHIDRAALVEMSVAKLRVQSLVPMPMPQSAQRPATRQA